MKRTVAKEILKMLKYLNDTTRTHDFVPFVTITNCIPLFKGNFYRWNWNPIIIDIMLSSTDWPLFFNPFYIAANINPLTNRKWIIIYLMIMEIGQIANKLYLTLVKPIWWRYSANVPARFPARQPTTTWSVILSGFGEPYFSLKSSSLALVNASTTSGTNSKSRDKIDYIKVWNIKSRNLNMYAYMEY